MEVRYAVFLRLLCVAIFAPILIAEGRAQPNLETVTSFGFALGVELDESTLEALGNYDLVVIDGTDAAADQVSSLKNNGVVVLGYASLGTIEQERWWSKRMLKRCSLGYWEDWDEYFASVKKRWCRRFFIKKIAQRILEKGFDGLFLDNVDMISARGRQTGGMVKALKRIRKLLGSERLLFFQNGDEIIDTLEARGVEFDGWNREDATSTYNFDSESYEAVSHDDHTAALATLSAMKAKGYFVTTADYVQDSSSAIAQESKEAACAVGAVPFVGDIYLTQLPETPLTCASMS